MEKVLYAQVVLIRQKDYDDKKKKEKKYNFQGNLQDEYAGSILIMSV